MSARVSVAMCAALIAGLLGACGGGGDQPPAASVPPPASAAASWDSFNWEGASWAE